MQAAAWHRVLSSVLCDDVEGCNGSGREVLEGREYICIQIADSLCCAGETNTAL